MTRAEVMESWRLRLAEYRRFAALVDGERIATQVLADLSSIGSDEAEETLSLTEASKVGGVSTRQLSRLVEQGKLENCGRKNAPRVRRRDIPRKASIDSGDSTGLSLQLARQAVSSKISARGRR